VTTPRLVDRMQGFGTTIFAEMSAIALETRSVNLGQGFPDTDGPPALLDTAVAAIRAGHNQYPPGPGIPALRQAVARHQSRFYDLSYDPDTEVLITTGATEAIASALIALAGPGDEVIVFEPLYDSYAASIAMGGATRRVVSLTAPDFRISADALRAAVTERTKVILLNTPHNPTGTVASAQELAAVAAVAVEHDLVVVTDEVYEHLAYEGRHVPIATLPGMRERTVTISSAGKSFNCTGWKVGWVCAPPDLVSAVRTTKQFLTYVSGAPFQPAVAAALDLDDEYYTGFNARMRAGRDRLCDGLEKAGFEVFRPAGGYFANVDVRSVGYSDGVEFCRDLPHRVGVVAIPVSVFCDSDMGRTLVRFAFCKRPEVIDEAVTRLQGLRG
jgi:N-succinyldiaminopimelate aminotransferase